YTTLFRSLVGHPLDRFSPVLDLTGGEPDQLEQQSGRGGLAAPGLSDERKGLAFPQFQGDPGNRLYLTDPAAQKPLGADREVFDQIVRSKKYLVAGLRGGPLLLCGAVLFDGVGLRGLDLGEFLDRPQIFGVHGGGLEETFRFDPTATQLVTEVTCGHVRTVILGGGRFTLSGLQCPEQSGLFLVAQIPCHGAAWRETTPLRQIRQRRRRTQDRGETLGAFAVQAGQSTEQTRRVGHL